MRDKINEIRDAIDRELWEQVKEAGCTPPSDLIAEARVLERVVNRFAEALNVWLTR